MELWLSFLLGSCSVWRVTHLLHAEDGPFDLFFRFRKWLGNGFFGQLTDCFYCLSLWVSAPFAGLLGGSFLEIFMLFWAMSGAAILLHRVSNLAKTGFPANHFTED